MFTKKQVFKISLITCLLTLFVSVSGTYIYARIKSFDILTHARNLIVENYVDPIDEKELETLNDYAIMAMVQGLHDPYSYYFDKETFESYEESVKEEYIGIGVTVSFDDEKDAMVVIAPTDGGPAQKAGILPGDIVTRVNDTKVQKDNYNSMVDVIRGEKAKKGTNVTLHIKRGETEMTVTVTRDVIPLNTVSFKMLDENVGYIRISEFKRNTVEDFEKALLSIQKENAKGLIIDLRSNPGGYADSVLSITDKLLPKGVIAYLEDNKGEREYFYSDDEALNLPMVVLVNEGTASAAELLAGSTKAYGVAKIIGTKTFGKAVGQMPIMLTEDTAIYLTSARYYTPKGECIDKKGITPDVIVDLPESLKSDILNLLPYEDTQLKTAIEVLYDSIG